MNKPLTMTILRNNQFRKASVLLLLSLTVALQSVVRGGGDVMADRTIFNNMMGESSCNIVDREELERLLETRGSINASDNEAPEFPESESGDENKHVDDFEFREQLSLLTKGPHSTGFANRPAISVGFPTNPSTWTHSQLHEDARRLAATMRRHMPFNSASTTNQHRVLLAVSTRTDYKGYVFLLACIKNAYSYVNTGEKVSHPMFDDIVEKVRPTFVIVDKITYDHYAKVRELVSKNPFGSVVLAMDNDVPGVPCLFDDGGGEDGDQNDAMEYDADTFPLDNEATVTFTSGSSGPPKLCAFSFKAMIRVAWKAQKMLRHDTSSVLLAFFQYADGPGYELQYLPSLLYGSHMIPLVRDDLEFGDTSTYTALELYNAVFARGVTMIVTTPAMLSYFSGMVDNVNAIAPTLTKSVRTIATLGAKLSTAVRDKAAHSLSVPRKPNEVAVSPYGNKRVHGDHDQRRLLEIYGSSECHIIGSKNAFDDNGGFLLADGVESRVVPFAKNKNKMDAGSMIQEGEIFIRSDHAMVGYADTKGVNSPFDEEGWLALGDVGFLSKGDSKLVLTGRTRTTINYDGEELDARLILQEWEETLRPKIQIEEAYVLPSDHGDENGVQSAALFLLPGSKNLDFENDLFDVTIDSYSDFYEDDDDDNHRRILFNAVQVVCFVDTFPRVGRDKVDLGEVLRAYTKLVTERKFAWAIGFKPSSTITVMQLQWKHDEKEWNVLEWSDLEDYLNDDTSFSYFDTLSSVSVGSRIVVYWDDEGEFYAGEVTNISGSGLEAKHHVLYDDGDKKWHSLEKERWQMLQA